LKKIGSVDELQEDAARLLERAEGIGLLTVFLNMEGAAPDFVDNQVIHNDEQRFESPTGFFCAVP